MSAMKAYLETIARVCHEANRVLQIAHGDPVPSPHWDTAPAWQRKHVAVGVEAALGGATPQELHETWCKTKFAAGWTYGPDKNANIKTHPCLMAYEDLPDEQRVKGHMFHAIVRAMSTTDTPRTES